MIRVGGETLTIEGSLLLNVTNTAPAGAGAASINGKGEVVFDCRTVPEGKTIHDPPAAVTVTVAGLLFVNPLFTINWAT
jgi:hypothetical protein